MNINIGMDRDFEITMENLRNKYGEKMEILNGVHPSQLDFSEFINNFVDKQTLADASIDSNANVKNKDICSLLVEKVKPIDKLFAWNKIFYEIKKEYGLNTAKEWAELEYNGAYYMHDFSSASYKPYCFAGDTEFITNKGIRKLKDAAGEDVTVLNRHGAWEHGVVKHFGKDKLYELTLENYFSQEKIYCTANHKWFLNTREGNGRGGEIVNTIDLKPGMTIPSTFCSGWNPLLPSPFGVAHGCFLGRGKPQGILLEDVSDGFIDLPRLDETPQYLYGFIAGFFTTHGSFDEKSNAVITAPDLEILEFIRNVFAIWGQAAPRIEQHDDLYSLVIPPRYLREQFFIDKEQKKEWLGLFKIWEKDNGHDEKSPYSWTVVSVEPTDREEDVYCVQTDKTESFALAPNILTHNCWATDLTRLAKEGLFFLDDYNNQAPKHLSTFLDDVIEYISFFSNRSSGALGLPNILIWSYYFWKKDVETGYFTKDPEYYRDQCFQKLLYRLSQPFLRIEQSASDYKGA